MKSIHHISTLACLALAGILAACGSNSSSSNSNSAKGKPTIVFDLSTDLDQTYEGVSPGGTITNDVSVTLSGFCTTTPVITYSSIDTSTEATTDKIVFSDVTPGLITYTAAGTYTITVSTAASANCAATDVTYDLIVAKATPTLVFTPDSVNVSTGTSVRKLVSLYGAGDDSTSRGRLDNVPVSYSSDNPRIATVNPTTGEVTAARLDVTADVFIRARYAGSRNYTGATASYTLRIRNSVPVIDFADISGDATSVTYAGAAGGMYTQAASVPPSGFCTTTPGVAYSSIDTSTDRTTDKIAFSDVTSGEVTYTAAGIYRITARTKLAPGCAVSADVTYDLTVNKATADLTFDSSIARSVATGGGTAGGKQYRVSLSGTGGDLSTDILGAADGGTITYSSDNTADVTVDSSTGRVTSRLDTTADVTIYASLTGSNNYRDITGDNRARYTLHISNSAPTLEFTDASADATYAGANPVAPAGTYTQVASVSPSGFCTIAPDVTYSSIDTSTNATTDTIVFSDVTSGEGTYTAAVTYTAAGSYTITASTKLAPGCAVSADVTYDLTVNKASPTIEFINPTTKVAIGETVRRNLARLSGVGGDPTTGVNGRTLDGKSITYSAVSDTSAGVVDNTTGAVTGKLRSSTGGVTIIAAYPGSANYNPTSDQYQLTVTLVPADLTAAEGSPIKKLIFSWEDVTDADHYKLWEVDLPGGMNTQVGENIIAGNQGDAQSITSIVPLFASAYTRYRLESCDNAYVCADSPNDLIITQEQLNRAIGYIKANNTGKTDYFGTSVSLSADGTTLAVGAYEEGSDATGVGNNPGEWTDMSNDDASYAGAVYVFTRNATTDEWTQQAYIKSSNINHRDNFGYSLSLSADGTTLAVGAYGEASDATGINGDQSNDSPDFGYFGAAYVFTRNATTKDWTQDAYVKASNTGDRDEFGYSLSLSADGTTLAVGAPYERSDATGVGNDPSEWDRMDNNKTTNAGAVYVFSRTNSTSRDWTQDAFIKASNRSRSLFGWSTSLSIDGNTLAVGAKWEGDSVGGAVYVFTRDKPGGWSEQAYIKASNENFKDEFGHAVSLSADGTTLAVGARYEDSNATGVGNDQSRWNTMDNDNTRRESGAVYLFTRNETTKDWTQDAYIKASNTGEKAEFGYSLSFDANGDILAVGAKGEGSNATGIDGNQSDNSTDGAGAVYLFTRNRTTNNWSQQAYIKASNTGGGDEFGYSVSLDASGDTLAVGAYKEDSNATGIDGNQSDNSADGAGAVYLY